MKQANVFLLDASSTMQTQALLLGSDDDDGDEASTIPFALAKRHVTALYGQTMMQSASSTASVVLCRTRQTTNHKCVVEENDDDDDDSERDRHNPFCHLTEIDSFGLCKGKVSVLRQLRDTGVEDSYARNNLGGGGTVLDGLRFAQTTLQESTAGKKFQRAVYLYTDCLGHDYEMDLAALQDMVGGLQALECPVHVVVFQSLYDPTDASADNIKSEGSAAVAAGIVKKEEEDKDESGGKRKVVVKDEPMPDSAIVKKEESSDVAAVKLESPIQPSPVKSFRKHNHQSEVKIKQENSDDDSVTDVEDGDDAIVPSPAPESKRIKKEESDNDNNINQNDDEEEDEDEDVVVLNSSKARDEFLQSIARQTGGTYRAIHVPTDLPMPTLTQKDMFASKTTLLLAPATGADITSHPYAIPVRLALTHAKQGAPVLKCGALVFDNDDGDEDEDAQLKNSENEEATKTTSGAVAETTPVPRRLETGDLITKSTMKLNKFVDLTDPDSVPVDATMTTDAMRYGSEWKVIDASFQHSTIPKDMPGPAIQIMGYVDAASTLDPAYCQGPCHLVTGHDSVKACAAVTALSRALHETGKAAIVLVAKTKSVKATKLGALVPGGCGTPANSENPPLYMIILPYEGEVKTMTVDNWMGDLETTPEEEKAACDLIDTLWLSDDQAETILNQSDPFQEAWKDTVLHRAVHPTSTELRVPRKRLGGDDPLATPKDVKENAEAYVNRFQETFPLVLKQSSTKDKERKGVKSLTYTDFLDDDE